MGRFPPSHRPIIPGGEMSPERSPPSECELAQVRTGRNRVWHWIVLIGLCLGTFFAAFEITPGQLGEPIVAGGDLLQACRFLKSSMVEGSYYRVHDLGAPFVAEHYGFPETFVIERPLVWLCSPFTNNIYLIYNLLYLFTYVSAALACFAVLRSLGCRPWPSLFLSWVYAYLPNHIERYDHYGISFYATAPLVVWYALACQRGRRIRPSEWILAPLCGLCGPYPAYFGCLTILCGAFLGCLYRRSFRPLKPALGLCSIITLTFLLVLAPALGNQKPEQAFLPHRSPSDLLRWSLSLDHLLLPAHARKVHPLYPISDRYYQNFPPPEEPNEAPYLGLLGIVGGIGLVLGLWRSHRFMPHLRRLCWSLFLIGTAGGLGQLFSLLLGTSIRCYNRLSFHLAFVLLAALGLQWSRKRWKPARIGLMGLLITLGVLEQILSTTHHIPSEAQTSVLSDRQFVDQLESVVPAHAMIWQYPYVPYPENPPAYQEGYYGLGRCYAVSHQIHWSWGCLKGNPQEKAQAALNRLPLARQVAILVETGFAGITVERRGYADGGQAFEAQLNQLGLSPRLVSPDKNLVFFPLASASMEPTEAAERFQQRIWEATWNGGLIDCGPSGWGTVFTRAGWDDPEPDGTWSTSQSNWLFLPQLSGVPKQVRVEAQLTPMLKDGNQSLEIYQGPERLGVWSFTEHKRYTLDFAAVLPATLRFEIKSPRRPSSMGGQDTRALGVQLHQLQVKP